MDNEENKAVTGEEAEEKIFTHMACSNDIGGCDFEAFWEGDFKGYEGECPQCHMPTLQGLVSWRRKA